MRLLAVTGGCAVRRLYGYSFYSGYSGYNRKTAKPQNRKTARKTARNRTKGNRLSENGYLLQFIPSPFTCGKVTFLCGKPHNIPWKTPWKLRELSTGGRVGQGSGPPVWKTSRVTNDIYRTCQHRRKPWNKCILYTISSSRNTLSVSAGIRVSPCRIKYSDMRCETYYPRFPQYIIIII